MQPSSGGFFSIQFFSTEAAAFVMPILFPDFCEYIPYSSQIIQVSLISRGIGRLKFRNTSEERQ
jgi:hypothetical protein